MAIIAIEGLDGAGKATVSNLLKEKLQELNPDMEVEVISFPDYTSSSGRLIKKFLSGEIIQDNWFVSDIERRNFISWLFIINRYEYFKNNPLDVENKTYIFDRYGGSNILYQCHGLSLDEINNYIDFIYNMEFISYKNPKPDFTFLLRVPYSKLRERLDARKEVKAGIEKDKFETDSFLKISYHLLESIAFAKDMININKFIDYIINCNSIIENFETGERSIINDTPESVVDLMLEIINKKDTTQADDISEKE